MEEVNLDQAFLMFDDPMPSGPTTQVHFVVKKSLTEGMPESQILCRLTTDFEQQSLFRKEQSSLGACLIYLQTEVLEVMTAAGAFLDRFKDAELPLLNQVECAYCGSLAKRMFYRSTQSCEKQLPSYAV